MNLKNITRWMHRRHACIFLKNEKSIKVYLTLLFSILFLFSFSTPTYAIRIVLSGGGAAEMMALSSLSQIPTVLNVAKEHPQEFQLTTQQLQVLEVIISNDYFNLENTQLDFKVTTPNEALVKYSQNNVQKMTVSTRLLYDHNKILPVETIAESIFAYWLLSPFVFPQISSLITSEDVAKLQESLFRNIRVIGVPSYLSEPQYKLWIFGINTRAGMPLSSNLAIETPKEIVDITNYAVKALNCPSKRTLKFVHFSNFSQIGNTLKGQVTWACGSQRFDAFLVSPLAQDLNPIQLSFSLVNIRQQSQAHKSL